MPASTQRDKIASVPAPARRRWRHSIYARATIFLLVGGGTLIGALIALSSAMVKQSVDRLLVERIDLAHTVAALLEQRILSDLNHLEQRIRPYVGEHPNGVALERALAAEYPATVFQEGVFVLDPAGRPVLSLPDRSAPLAAATDLTALVRAVTERQHAVSSSLLRLGAGKRSVLLVLAPISAPQGGFIGGVFQPAATSILKEVVSVRDEALTTLDLVDPSGTVVASTQPSNLFRSGDHDRVLQQAIGDRREFKGRCHSCHTVGASSERATDILAFAPLPTLNLGVAAYQPEADALAPAFRLRRRLSLITAIVGLFIFFAGVSVHSVVRPVVRLTRAVQEIESADAETALPRFGQDEIGALARALERWRGRVYSSLQDVEDHRRLLRQEAEATRRHLDALEDIATQSTHGSSIETILEHGLGRALIALGLTCGALRLSHDGKRHVVAREVDEAERDCMLARCEEWIPRAVSGEWISSGSGRCAVKTIHTGKDGDQLCAPRFKTLVVSSLRAMGGVEIDIALAGPEPHQQVEERWLHSLLYHLSMAATTRFHRDQDLVRQLQQERYLRGVLRAQEAERSRIARELHDTVAQDLAALRLEIERVMGRTEPGQGRAQLDALEQRAAGILETTRRILLDLRLTVLESMGLLPTIQWHLERLEKECGIRATLSVDGDEVQVEYDRAVTLYRIFQESINNVVQHAEAEQVFVTVGFGKESVSLTVEDDGAGFEASEQSTEARQLRPGLGLLGMEERARLLGGELVLTTQLGEGTTVHVTVPLSGPANGSVLVKEATS